MVDNIKKKCCKCHYIKSKGKFYKVKGPWSSCSYDSDNCCKDKKTIVKPKTKKKRKTRKNTKARKTRQKTKARRR